MNNLNDPPCGTVVLIGSIISQSCWWEGTHFWDPVSSGHQRKQVAVEVTVIQMRHNSTLQTSNMSIWVLEICAMPPILSWLASLLLFCAAIHWFGNRGQLRFGHLQYYKTAVFCYWLDLWICPPLQLHKIRYLERGKYGSKKWKNSI